MSALGINENDLDSPGYEFLRSHRNMINLYYKLVSLDCHRDFCPAYKCPPINQYYFSSAHKNSFEQQFVFTCLCAWLIRDKCQMNFDLDLEDISASVSAIVEALKLLHEDGELDTRIHLRLEQGYGPEVIYALSCFADRALEVALEQDPSLGLNPKIYFHNKVGHDQARPANSITIGQPIVGGTLTTRSLGKYFIEDSSLVLDHQGEEEERRRKGSSASALEAGQQLDPSDWEQQVTRLAPQLRAVVLSDACEGPHEHNWQEYLRSITTFKRAIQGFMDQSRPVLQAIEARVDRQMQVVNGREKFLQTNLGAQLESFLGVWRERSARQEQNDHLMDLINGRTDSFETYNARLKTLAADIETRIRELNDGSKLRELEGVIGKLEAQSDDLDVRLGLLLAVYGKR